jgi:N,N'-diacetyllegionaminate synthase
MPVEIIAEGEINHNGDVELAKRIVTDAKNCGADSVKFQCFVTECFNAPGAAGIDLFKENELTLDEFRQVRDHAKNEGITMISTAGDLEGLQMIVDLDLPIVKVGSTNITHVSLLKAIAATSKPVYLSTGASTSDEINQALQLLNKNGAGDITLFHCTVAYPASDKSLNLLTLRTMITDFPDCKIGYSDHSLGGIAATAAIALGAQVVEKHFTSDKSLPGPDHNFSADPQEFTDYVETIRRVEAMLGSAEKRPTEDEAAGPRLRGRRYVTAFENIAAGQKITAKMIRPRRIDADNSNSAQILEPEWEAKIIGVTALRDIPEGKALTAEDVNIS